ncbi:MULTISPECIES: cytochrome P450 [unclassified Nostoc]|uniref:cytochrome P450 n=1 Tax=unclassified Nostoc TaxID=2593658 RepID=UPI002AD53F25|nr:cytochrome P450 [Nostoc sp. DedQUE03]MDZ7976376.1 cytochrome P450 [Nostoc sp. DedQUE03]MDZ8047990.1 cytochrome P450 [Nostoc sp. DedQUE02]
MITLKENLSEQNVTKLPDGNRRYNWWRTIKVILQPIEILEETQRRYGDIFTSKFASFPTQILISNPQAIQALFTADSQLFDSGSGNEIIQPLVGANSVILLDGDRHLQQRKLLMPTFHGERMRAYGELIREITVQVTSQWSIGKPFIARASMQDISLQVILRAVFGLKEGERYQQIKHILTEMLDTFNTPLSAIFLFFKSLQRDLGAWSPWGKFIRRRQQLDELIYQEIHERRHQAEYGEDILSLLMSARDEQGQPMSDVELRDELMTMLFAGHETTAISLAWALYWIHYVPEVCEKLLLELNSLDLAHADPTTITQLPYLNAVCSETLRITPVAFFSFPRILKAPMKFMGYDLPKGIMISPCIYLTHHRPDIYLEPQRFQPERFLERQFSPYEFLPFGGGNRRCLGMTFALFEMKLVLATILSQYSLELLDQVPLKPVRRGIVFAPPGGVRLRVKK